MAPTSTASLLRRLCRRHVVAMGGSLALAMALAHSGAAKPQADPLLVTSACDEERSRATAKTLFEFAERQFDPYRTAQPLEVKVIQETQYLDRSPSFVHEAKFATFAASYHLLPDGTRALRSLTTSSASFKLPAGVKIGQSKVQVLHALGPPTAMSSSSVLYEIGGEAISEVFLNFERGRLVQVRWEYGAAD